MSAGTKTAGTAKSPGAAKSPGTAKSPGEPEPDILVKLNAAERRMDWPNCRPKDAATIILLDRKGKVPRMLMGRRHAGHRFLPNLYVFPGGRLEAADARMPVHGVVDAESERRLMERVQRPTLSRSRGLAAAAIRELFEETGLLLGTRDLGAPKAPAKDWGMFESEGVFPNLEALTYVARAITPPRRPKRFDTRFFCADADAVCGQVAGVVGPDAELTELRWLSFRETEAIELPAITRAILSEIEARIEAGFAPRLPVPFFFWRGGRFQREYLP
ncbi:NUDIX hydrolase [Xanthobacter pseudotagetidis]|uniref:NUDIX hydrolase n=1 Tax=Xanthobacter pseudotagetidis TaxID=3119911 RepID=UPI00372CD35D